MNRNSESGFTILEIVFAATLGLILTFAVGKIVISWTKANTRALNQLDSKSQLAIAAGYLQKFMATADTRFLAFTGNAGNTPADKLLFRMLLPLPGVCADLGSCPNDVSLLFMHYAKNATPAVTALCDYTSVAGAPPSFLVDLNDGTYGPAQTDTQGFKVISNLTGTCTGTATATDTGWGTTNCFLPYSTGIIPATTKSVIAALSPPNATLWVVSGAPAQLNAAQIAALPPKCVPASGNTTQLYQVPVAPLVPTQFTTAGGQGAVLFSDIDNSMGAFPLRLMPAKIRTVGRTSNQNTLVVNDCSITGLTQNFSGVAPNQQENIATTLSCGGTPSLKVNGATQICLDESYSLALYDSSQNQYVNNGCYQMLSTAQNVTSACTTPPCQCLQMSTCTALPIPDNTKFSGWLTTYGTENYQTLNDVQFTLIKEEVLSRIGIKIYSSTNMEPINVFFR